MESTFWVLAIIGTVVFGLKLALMFMGFGDHGDADAGGGDLDLDGDVDGHEVGHGTESSVFFTFLSLQGIATFVMGFGWCGLVGLNTWGLDDMQSSVAAFGFGAFCVLLLGKLLQQAMKLESSGNLDPKQAIGQTGRVYMRIPEDGRGKVQLEVQGRLVTWDARSDEGEIETGKPIEVDDVDGAGVLLVSLAD